MDRNRAQLKTELIRDEGLRLDVYQDSVGLWTIGVGHLLGKERRMMKITFLEADALLESDISLAEEALDRVIPEWKNLDGVRQRALINMMFNRGERHVRESTTITPAIIKATIGAIDHDIAWRKVAEAIKSSPWAAQVKDRAVRLAEMFEKGSV